MRCFPQLLPHGCAQWPIATRRRLGAAVNETPDGYRYAAADPGADERIWTLQYDDLTDDEAAALEAFADDCGGARETFTFLDPTANLLRWSERLDQPVWVKGGGAPAAIAGPHDGAEAWRLGGPGSIRQEIAAPSQYEYCFSVHVREAAGARLIFGNERRAIEAGAAWTRVSWTVRGPEGDGAIFGVEADGGVDLYGLQVDAQSSASPYRRSLSGSGVHPAARLDGSEFAIVRTGPNRNACGLRIVAYGN